MCYGVRMRYADELKGSEGERCIVGDLRRGIVHHGVIEQVHDEGRKVTVLYDTGLRVRVGYGFVSLTEPETA